MLFLAKINLMLLKQSPLLQDIQMTYSIVNPYFEQIVGQEYPTEL